jgi:hypothetical protein
MLNKHITVDAWALGTIHSPPAFHAVGVRQAGTQLKSS